MAGASSSLVIDLQPGQGLEIGGIRLQLVHKSGRAARLRVTAPRDVSIVKRSEEALGEVVPRMAQSENG